MTTNDNLQLSTTETKKQTMKQSEQKENYRYGDHIEGYQWGGGGRMEEKVQGIRSINGRYKINRGRLRIV